MHKLFSGNNDCCRFFLGIDGGGTKTTALVTDADGTPLAETCGDTINYCAVGLPRARENMRRILETLTDMTGIQKYASVFIGMSALYERATQEETVAFCDGIFNAECITMDSDLFIALAATGERGAAAVGICGTGSMTAGRREDGSVFTKGGYGYILGDEGSAYRIALDGVRAAVSAADGAAQPTLLTDAALSFWQTESCYGLIERFYNPPMERNRIAAFAPCVTAAAEQGDLTALQIQKDQATLFAATAKALLRELPAALPFYVYGGVFAHASVFLKFFREAMGETPVLPLPCRPVEGAVSAAVENYTKGA